MSSGSSAATAQPVVAPASPAEAARALRHQRARKLIMGFVLWVLVPTLCASIYFGFVASAQYESVATLAVRGPDAKADAAMLRDFIHSRAALQALDEGSKLRSHYQAHGDAFSRLSEDGAEALFRYYRGKVDARYDEHAGLLHLRVRAFSGAAAHQFATRLVAASEDLLERTGQRNLEMRITHAEAALARAKQELLDAQRALTRAEDPQRDGSALEQRVTLEGARLEQKLAERSYEGARNVLDGLRAERARATQLVVVAEPSRPDDATHPRRAYAIVTVFFAALALFGIGKLLVSAVREHGQF